MQVHRSRPRVRARQPTTSTRAGQVLIPTTPTLPFDDPANLPVVGPIFDDGDNGEPPLPPELLAIGGGLLLLLLLVALVS